MKKMSTILPKDPNDLGLVIPGKIRRSDFGYINDKFNKVSILFN